MTHAEKVEKARKAMVRAMKKHGANSAQFEAARNKWQAIIESDE